MLQTHQNQNMPGREGGANPRGGQKMNSANPGNQNYKYQ